MIKPTSIIINRYESNINIHTYTKRPQGHIYENTGTQEAKQLIDYIIDGVQWVYIRSKLCNNHHGHTCEILLSMRSRSG